MLVLMHRNTDVRDGSKMYFFGRKPDEVWRSIFDGDYDAVAEFDLKATQFTDEGFHGLLEDIFQQTNNIDSNWVDNFSHRDWLCVFNKHVVVKPKLRINKPTRSTSCDDLIFDTYSGDVWYCDTCGWTNLATT